MQLAKECPLCQATNITKTNNDDRSLQTVSEKVYNYFDFLLPNR